MSTAPYVALAKVLDRVERRLFRDPLLDPGGADEPNILDTVDPAWGLPAGPPDFPARVAEREVRTGKCGACGGLGFVATHVDGDAGYRPCHRCPQAGDAA